MDEPIEITMSGEAFSQRNWSRHIRGFRFQNDALPPLMEWCQQCNGWTCLVLFTTGQP
jgi:hypothetical protein